MTESVQQRWVQQWWVQQQPAQQQPDGGVRLADCAPKGTLDASRFRLMPGKRWAVQVDPDRVTDAVKRLRRAQGQIAGVVRMLEEGRDCAEVVTQLAAVARALDKAGFAIVAAGLVQCMEAGEQGKLDRRRLERLFLSLA